jgi:hypothetical protein
VNSGIRLFRMSTDIEFAVPKYLVAARKRQMILIAAMAGAWGLGTPSRASEAPARPQEASISDHLKAAGAEAERETKSLSTAIKATAAKVGAAAKKMAHQVAGATAKGAHEVEQAGKEVAAKSKAAVRGESPDGDKKPPT